MALGKAQMRNFTTPGGAFTALGPNPDRRSLIVRTHTANAVVVFGADTPSATTGYLINVTGVSVVPFTDENCGELITQEVKIWTAAATAICLIEVSL